MTDPAEALAQQVAGRVVDLVANALDVNALVARVDLNAVLSRVDVAALLARVDVDQIVQRVDVAAVVDQVDVNQVVQRVDMDALVEETDLGAVIARSSGGAVSEALDALRSQAVGLDQFIDRWVGRLTRRKQPWPAAPPALRAARIEP
jgi:hypothetical protein